MEQDSTTTQADGTMLFAGEAWFDPIEAGFWERIRGLVEPRGLPDIEELLEQELTAALGRRRHERALAALWPDVRLASLRPDVRLASLRPDVPAQRCTVHTHRNLLAHAPDALHEAGAAERTKAADYTDMIYADTPKAVQDRRRAVAFRTWRLRCPAVATSLEETGDRLFACLRLPPSQWQSARTTNAIERLHERFKRRIKTQTVLPSAETAAMLFWALMASGQITLRKVDGWETLAKSLGAANTVDLAA